MSHRNKGNDGNNFSVILCFLREHKNTQMAQMQIRDICVHLSHLWLKKAVCGMRGVGERITSCRRLRNRRCRR